MDNKIALDALTEPTRCACNDRPASGCPGEWEPGCYLGNNPKYVRVGQSPAQAPVAQAVPENCGTGHCSCIECVVEVQVVQAGEYPPEPWPEDFAGWLEVLSDDEIKAEFRAYVDADRAARAQPVRMLTKEQITNISAACYCAHDRDGIGDDFATLFAKEVLRVAAQESGLQFEDADGEIGGV